MELDEAIKRYADNAEYERAHGNLQGCLEFRQLAEWLKDYERLLEQQSCDDAISRQSVLDDIARIGLWKSEPKEVQAVAECLRAVEALAPVTPQPKTGQWLNDELIPNDISGHVHAECSICHKVRIVDNYCPNCGAKMEVEE